MKNNDMKSKIEEQAKEFSDRGWTLGDINGKIASHIREKHILSRLKELHDVLYMLSQSRYKNMKNLIEDAWEDYQESIELLHIEMAAYMQVIDEKIQKEIQQDDDEIELDDVVKKECGEVNTDGIWKVKMKDRRLVDYPDWFGKVTKYIDIDYRRRYIFKGEAISEGDLFIKKGDDLRLLKQDEKNDDFWVW